MSPAETAELMRDLQIVRGEEPELSLVIIEHDMFVIEGVSQRVVAFNYGRKIAEGTFAEVAAHREVREAYLGKEADVAEPGAPATPEHNRPGDPGRPPAMLEVRAITTRYGPLTVLRGVSLRVEAGEIACLLGPNGAGKTTLIRTSSGSSRPWRARSGSRESGSTACGPTRSLPAGSRSCRRDAACSRA